MWQWRRRHQRQRRMEEVAGCEHAYKTLVLAKERKKFVSSSDKITQNDTLHTCTGDNANSSRQKRE